MSCAVTPSLGNREILGSVPKLLWNLGGRGTVAYRAGTAHTPAPARFSAASPGPLGRGAIWVSGEQVLQLEGQGLNPGPAVC